jgi:hypothetical protein
MSFISSLKNIATAGSATAAIVGSIVAFSGETLAAGNFNNPEDKKVMCRYYANEAGAQARANVELDCKGHGDAWGLDVEKHYNWCLTQRDTRNLVSGSSGRATEINHCNKCSDWARARLRSEMEWIGGRCDWFPQLQQPDRYRGGHYTPRTMNMLACMKLPRMSTYEMDAERRADNEAVARCQKAKNPKRTVWSTMVKLISFKGDTAAPPPKTITSAGKAVAPQQTSLKISSLITDLSEFTETAKAAPVLKTYQLPPPKRLISHKGKGPQPLPKRLISHKGKALQPATEIDPPAEDTSVVAVDTDEPEVEEAPAKKKRTQLIVIGSRYVEVPAFDEPADEGSGLGTGGFNESMSGAADALKEKVKDGLSGSGITKAASGAADALKEKLADGLGKGGFNTSRSDVVDAVKEKIKDGFKGTGGITKAASGAAEALKEKLADGLGKGGFNTSRSDVVDALKEKVKDGLSGGGVTKGMSGAAEALKTKLKDRLDGGGISKAASGAVEAMKEKIKSGGRINKALAGAAGTLKSKVKDRFKGTGGITKAMSGAAEGMKSKLKDRVAGGGLMKKAASGFKEKFKSKLSGGGGGGMMKGMAKAGGGLMRGLLRR